MKKVAVLVLAALALLAFSGALAYADNGTVTLQLNEQNNSGQSGTAVVTGQGDKTQVVINLSNGTAEPQPAHIHEGTCANLNPKPKYPLSNVVNGSSDTVVDVSLNHLTSESYAINVHKSKAEVGTYVACADIVMNIGMPRTGNGNQAFMLAALALAALGATGVGLKLSRRRA